MLSKAIFLKFELTESDETSYGFHTKIVSKKGKWHENAMPNKNVSLHQKNVT